MPIGTLTLYLQLPGCTSLKEKRSALKPLLTRLHREFNLSTSEVGLQDRWHEALILCAMAGSDRILLERALHEVAGYTARMWPDLPVLEEKIEIW